MECFGIDYSLNSPAGCLLTNHSVELFCVSKKPLNISYLLLKELNPQVKIEWIKIPETYENNFYRIKYLADLFLDIITTNSITQVAFEDYSYHSTGLVFNLAEATGYLKMKLYERGIIPCLFAPKQIKKWATGNGNANKELMLETFKNQLQIDIYQIFNINKSKPLKRIPSPLPDISDAYFIAQYFKEFLGKK